MNTFHLGDLRTTEIRGRIVRQMRLVENPRRPRPSPEHLGSLVNAPKSPASASVRYEPDEKPTMSVSIGLALQYCVLSVGGIVITVAVVARAAGQDEAYVAWAAFAALLVCGISTMVQAKRVGRLGAGYVLLMGTSGAFIAVSVSALTTGGPALLSALIIVSSLFQFALAHRLALIRRVVTPTVAGTVIMLIAVAVTPIVMDFLGDLPAGAAPSAAPVIAVVTLAATMLVVLRASGPLRLWAPLIGIGAGCLVAFFFDVLDGGALRAADWIGVPLSGRPGLALDLGPAFWSLLPAYTFVTVVGAIETIGDAVAVQRVSWRTQRATDYRAVQGAVAADGLGNMLSGLGATVPNTTYSSSVSIVEITGIAARRVGVVIGVILCILAFFPKVAAVLLVIPNPVVGSYLLVVIGVLFVLGARVVVQDGLDYRKATIVGVSFWVGAGFQSGQIPADILGPVFQELLGNGMTSGGLTALALSGFLELSGPRRKHLTTILENDSLHRIQEFLVDGARRKQWSDAGHRRLAHAAEEALLVLLDTVALEHSEPGRRLRVTARFRRDQAEVEMVAAGGEENIEDRMAVAGVHGAEAGEEYSLKLLRHLATTVRHQQYEDTDILTLRVKAHGAPAGDHPESQRRQPVGSPHSEREG